MKNYYQYLEESCLIRQLYELFALANMQDRNEEEKIEQCRKGRQKNFKMGQKRATMRVKLSTRTCLAVATRQTKNLHEKFRKFGLL